MSENVIPLQSRAIAVELRAGQDAGNDQLVGDALLQLLLPRLAAGVGGTAQEQHVVGVDQDDPIFIGRRPRCGRCRENVLRDLCPAQTRREGRAPGGQTARIDRAMQGVLVKRIQPAADRAVGEILNKLGRTGDLRAPTCSNVAPPSRRASQCSAPGSPASLR